MCCGLGEVLPRQQHPYVLNVRYLGICPVCGEPYELAEMEADHITPWHSGGKTIATNCKTLCKDDNRRKSGV